LSNSNFIEALPAEKGGIEGKRWGMLVDVEKCTKAASQGCRKCIEACRKENNIPVFDDPRKTPEWIKVVKVKNEFDDSKELYVPLLCNHCEHAPCVQVCPVGATFKTPDGVVLVDPKYCIGCRYCIQACPYGARYIYPEDGKDAVRRNTADKCTFCYHRLRRGLKPACVEVCPTKARMLYDLGNPDEKAKFLEIVSNNNVAVLKPEMNTKPKVFYIGIDSEVR
jgi:Fe-S-cluster-containing dehydrogenase component